MQISNASLKEIKEKMINKVLDELSGIGHMSQAEQARYKADLLSKINSKTLCTTVREQSGLTNAYDYNKTAYELYIDILTTFDYINELYDTLNKHQQLNQSIINTLNSTIGALNDKLDEVEAVIGVKGHPECFMDNFRTEINRETDTKYYRERYGEIANSAVYAMYNPDQETLTLNYTRRQNVLMYKSGVQLGEIFITKQYGAGFVKARNSEAKINNALDTSKANYWSETILCDSEMKVKGAEYEDFEYMTQYNRSFYDIPRGALCEVCIQFESMTKINELILNPFGNFPIDIVAVRYSYSDSEEAECYDILNPDGSKYDWLKQTTLNKEYEFHFPDIICKRIYILFNQLHCVKNTYLISTDQMFKNELWFNATNPDVSKLQLDNTTVFAPMYLDRAQEDPIWLYINNKMNTDKNIDVNDLLINAKNKYLPCTKYQYTYGFYNIISNYVEFQNTSIYVTKEITASGVIKSISLTTDEEHYKSLDNGREVTDIEYYITTKENPSYLDWHPICPKNRDKVFAEKLQIDYDVCYLLHPAICGPRTFYDESGNPYMKMVRPIIRLDDQVLTEDVDYILHFDENLNAISVEIANADQFAIYTAEYIPSEDAKELSLIEGDDPVPNNSYEVINGNGSSCYELNNYPYYNHSNPSATNSFVKIINTQTGEVYAQTDEKQIRCVTNKQNPAESYKNLTVNKAGVSLTGSIQYYTNGKYIYFNRPISPAEKIEVSYPSFDSKIRMKIIFRKNSKRDFWMTPTLHSYKLEFTTI